MKNISHIIFIFLVAVCFGCTSSGFHASSNITNVRLSEGNYNIVANSVRGEAEARYILGYSYGFGVYNQTMALIPIDRERDLHVRAIDRLWRNFEMVHGKAEGRKLALVNIRYDSQAVNLFFYTRPKVIVVADVIEFE